CLFLFFFFQAEDGIRDLIVTGVQTCALPISLRRFGEAQLVVDESWALARGDYALLVGIGAFLWVCWVVGTAVGLALGSVIGDPSRYGIDGAFAALFVALLATQVRSRTRARVAVLGGVIA